MKELKNITNMNTYNAKVLKVFDGDTITLSIDLGFSVHTTQRCRLRGIDTPEVKTKNKREKSIGLAARDYVRELILGKTFEIRTYKDGKCKYGRYLIDLVLNEDKVTLNNLLIDVGYARAYDGGKRGKW